MRSYLAVRLAVIVVLLGLVTLPTRAQRRRHDTALLLARTCVHEAGWRSPEDCAAIWRVWLAGAEREGLSPASFGRAYSRRLLVLRSVARTWAAHLERSGSEPVGWPRTRVVRDGASARVELHAPWSAYRERWLGVLAVCDAIVRGEGPALPESCAPTDWGGPGLDDERAARIGLVEVDCGDTANRYYVRPSRREGAR